MSLDVSTKAAPATFTDAPASKGFLPVTRPNGADGKKTAPAVETRTAGGERGQDSQVSAAPAVAAPRPASHVEMPAAPAGELLYQEEKGPPDGTDERAEQRALIADGVALLVRGARAQRSGRPSVIDAELKAKISALLATGLSMRQAAAFLGVSHPTISKAIATDRELREELKMARTRATLHPLACILREAGRNWKAAVWLLEHLQKVAFQEQTPVEKAEISVQTQINSEMKDKLEPLLMAEAPVAMGMPPANRQRR